MAETIAKTCRVCNADLNGQKRVKNSQGEYFCPECWKSTNDIFGDVADVTVPASPRPSLIPQTPTTQKQVNSPTVRVVRSELEPTMKQAVLRGAKEGAITALVRKGSKLLVFLILIGVLTATKKTFPDLRNGPMAIVTITSILVGVVIVELLARAANIGPIWMDSQTLKSRVGIMAMIGFGLAYAFAIAMTVAGGY